MKKVFSLFMCLVILVLAASVPVSAVNGSLVYEYEINGKECTVEFENGNLSDDKMQFVAEKLLGLRDGSVQTYGLGCTLFGHDYIYETASVNYHKVRTTVPRCDKRTFKITTCEDCDYYKQELIASTVMNCCPED